MNKSIKKILIVPGLFLLCLVLLIVIYQVYYFILGRSYDTKYFDSMLWVGNYLDLLTLTSINSDTNYFGATILWSTVIGILILINKISRMLLIIVVAVCLLITTATVAHFHIKRPYGVDWYLCKIKNDKKEIDIPYWYNESLKFIPMNWYRKWLHDGNRETGRIIYKEGNQIEIESYGQTMIARLFSEEEKRIIHEIGAMWDSIDYKEPYRIYYQKTNDTLIINYGDKVKRYFVPKNKRKGITTGSS